LEMIRFSHKPELDQELKKARTADTITEESTEQQEGGGYVKGFLCKQKGARLIKEMKNYMKEYAPRDFFVEEEVEVPDDQPVFDICTL